ncbi:helix-turn-helix domain-containing protein [Pseudomonas amygdali]|uniref:HTH cro/C1-type domain-containing protein n=2 Tax=Pseudomonas amygdali pv. lachrymans TaxID=53707 RepID=A0ABR5KQ87_PSEAV|nr:helix-turn-helix transcriptional regulator [Pseudomonas amygdali]AXH59542.1 XRE family transcriptional regulator [Pseudomonas amygdali pv. lachrymans str. M301315]KPC16972.1 Uncharacterized protein AC499_0174 [Pseudomonas amygdali pv. lachrymans]KPC17931.1 Uncharacterized protein AC499_1133 [Pseudomonas amygdali pv. lachrymans]RMT06237.1 hypothetical protein ALP54_03466 [Pseudomonas amygdali pv. lachrymans]
MVVSQEKGPGSLSGLNPDCRYLLNKGRLGFYGKEVRKLRIDKDMRLYEMAEAVGLSAAFLSTIEKGDRVAPKNLVEKVVGALGLEVGGKEHRSLDEAVMLDRGYVTVDISKASTQAQDVAVKFARSLGSLNDAQLTAVLAIVNKGAPSQLRAC